MPANIPLRHELKFFISEMQYQVLSRQQALYGYTAAGTYTSRDEDIKCKIRHGMLADFITLDTDLLTCSAKEILNAKVTATYIGGECVFSR